MKILAGHPITKLLTRAQALPVLAYVAAFVGLMIIAWLALAGLVNDYRDYVATADMLERIESHRKLNESGAASGSSGSPFLEGPTLTVAGAALQQRVAAAVKEVGGSVLSSQIELQAPDAKPGYISLTASCEVDQAMLQQLLYDLESGMPYLFIDQVQVQAPSVTEGSGADQQGARLKVQIDVSGQWQAVK
ncbi:type II secretion system protein GspM [Methylocapsa palsarum]|uniref:General secretion pathway protein M n=1 Tax=Methylocapsa palsarum TaxID=1612308 RepID=A0A1I4CCC7_9HYPH|nr:type II secretion system protein GspM [Methylocapsa palsarum]SFK77967.1 general secretion pathway protein M [Methylocapsa palsarum]